MKIIFLLILLGLLTSISLIGNGYAELPPLKANTEYVMIHVLEDDTSTPWKTTVYCRQLYGIPALYEIRLRVGGLTDMPDAYRYLPIDDGSNSFSYEISTNQIDSHITITCDVGLIEGHASIPNGSPVTRDYYIGDSDKDDIINTADHCPGEPETYNDYLDDDGCSDTLLPTWGTIYFTYVPIDEDKVVLGETKLYCTKATEIPPGTQAAITIFKINKVTIARDIDINDTYTIPRDYEYSNITVQCRVDVIPIGVDIAVSNTYDQPIIDTDNDGINDYHDRCPLDADDACPRISQPNSASGGPADPNNSHPRDLGTTTNDDTNTSTPVKQIRKSNSGCADCTPPTLGLDKTFKRVVDNGFTYNGNTVHVEKWYTEFPLINATVGVPNLVEIKVYENTGISNMRWVQFCLGAEERGMPLNDCEVLIEVHLLTNGTTTDIGIKEIVITDKENLIENDTVRSHPHVTKCMEDSTTLNCVRVDLEYTYREDTLNHMLIVNVADKPRNSQNFHFNEGVNVIGESLNEVPIIRLFDKHTSQQKDDLWITYTRTDKRTDTWFDESGIEYHRINDNRFDRITPQVSYQCTDPPLDEVKVWKRTNCHFRALTELWSYP